MGRGWALSGGIAYRLDFPSSLLRIAEESVADLNQDSLELLQVRMRVRDIVRKQSVTQLSAPAQLIDLTNEPIDCWRVHREAVSNDIREWMIPWLSVWQCSLVTGLVAASRVDPTALRSHQSPSLSRVDADAERSTPQDLPRDGQYSRKWLAIRRRHRTPPTAQTLRTTQRRTPDIRHFHEDELR